MRVLSVQRDCKFRQIEVIDLAIRQCRRLHQKLYWYWRQHWETECKHHFLVVLRAAPLRQALLAS